MRLHARFVMLPHAPHSFQSSSSEWLAHLSAACFLDQCVCRQTPFCLFSFFQSLLSRALIRATFEYYCIFFCVFLPFLQFNNSISLVLLLSFSLVSACTHEETSSYRTFLSPMYYPSSQTQSICKRNFLIVCPSQYRSDRRFFRIILRSNSRSSTVQLQSNKNALLADFFFWLRIPIIVSLLVAFQPSRSFFPNCH